VSWLFLGHVIVLPTILNKVVRVASLRSTIFKRGARKELNQRGAPQQVRGKGRGRSRRDEAIKERKRGLDDDDDSGVNTARSSGQSATKAPEEKSHLSLLRLVSRPLVLSFLSFDEVSLSTTRVATVTLSCARACISDTYKSTLLFLFQSPREPPYLPLSLSFLSIEYYIFHWNEYADTARLQQNHLQMHTRAVARVDTSDSRQRRRWCRCKYR